jgi:FkbM family methyltransferase
MGNGSSTPARVRFAHWVAGLAGALSPWWRFRLWARLAGPAAYANYPDDVGTPTKVWPHDAVMELRRGDWMERYAYEAGRFYQDDLIQTLMAQVQPGMTFVDVGANLGFVTLTASKLVGPAGRVLAIEANSDLVERLGRTLAQNAISNVELRAVALGAEAGQVVLRREGHHGTSHIAFDAAGGQTVPLERGDDVVGQPPGPVFVKLDVEGAELMVLEGMPNLIARADVTWLVEICASQLARFGATPQDVFNVMAVAGYRAFAPALSPFSRRTRLDLLKAPTGKPLYDVLFAR